MSSRWDNAPRPLDSIGSLRTKLGIVIVATVFGTITMLSVGRWLGIDLIPRITGAALIGLIVAQVLARGTTSPLREMATAATEMARGDYSRRVRDSSRDEIGDLGRAFNAMAADLAEVDRQRRDLVANVSHELRTPIGALRVLLENLVDGIEPTDPQQLETALAQTERLGRLVEQLLDLSRLESGGVPLRPEPFALGGMLEQAVRERQLGLPDEDDVAQPAAQLEWSVQPPELELIGDEERLHQVLGNLLDNALRHSPPGGTVRAEASIVAAGVSAEHPAQLPRPAGERIRIVVSDEGPGIPPDEAERVFERFYRTDRARSSQDGGTGLGLAISRWIVDAHGGSIHATSGQPTGCRMIVELPR